MDKKDLKIVIVDDSKVSYVAIKTMLKSIGFENIKYFEYPLEYVKYLKTIKEDEIDIVFIDYQMPIMNGLKVLYYTKFKYKDIIAVMMTSSTDVKLKEKAIKYGINEFMNKGIDFFEFKTKLNILANLRFYYYESKIQQEKLESLLQYKDTQETLAVQKQLKIIEDKVSHHYFYEDNWLVDSYFKPKDILSGDSYSTLKASDDVFFVSIVDGMGKGISASLSSVLTVSFMNYSIKKSLEFNDFNFERVVRDTFRYAASIMLDNEALSFVMLEINLKEHKVKYCNLGMPPLYLTNKSELIKIKPNNRPLLQNSKEYIIDEYNGEFDSILVSSDGLFESTNKDGYPYFVRYKQEYDKFYLLSDLLKDFKTNVEEADDDMSIVYMRRDSSKYENIFHQDVLLNEDNIQHVVDNLEPKIEILPPRVKDKIIFALNELLINCYEHAVLKISKNKHEIIQKDKKIEYNGKDDFADLTILKSDKYAVIILKDNGSGFDVSQILKSEWFNKYHGRGIKMLKKISDGMYYNEKGNHIKLYFKL
jgi:FixJ family two-component response regulator